MFIPFLFLLLFFCTSNARNAQLRGLAKAKWIFLTIISSFAGVFVASFIIVGIMVQKNPMMKQYLLQNNQKALNELLVQNLIANNFLYTALILAGSFGGYLLIRFLIEKKPVKTQQ